MALITSGFGFGDPFFDQMERALQRTLDRNLSSGILVPATSDDLFPTVAGSKPMDLIDKENEYEIIADAPGMNPEEITVEVHDNVLTIRGRHRESKEERDQRGKVVRGERVRRSFARSFTLPEDAKPDEIQAHLDKGVLRVVVPKVPPAEKPQPKRITVQPAPASTSA